MKRKGIALSKAEKSLKLINPVSSTGFYVSMTPKKQPETTPTLEKPTTPDNPTTPTTETPKKETPTTPKTGDDRNPLIWLLLLGLGGGLAGAAWYLRKKDEKDQKQD